MRRSQEAVRRVFDAIGDRLHDGRPYLLGDRFGAADIAFAAFASPMVLPPEHPKVQVALDSLAAPLAAEIRTLREHPAGLYALRTIREWCGGTGSISPRAAART